MSSQDPGDNLTPEQEAEAQELLRRAGLVPDESKRDPNIAGTGIVGGATVALTHEDFQKIHDAAVEVILANIESEAPAGRQAELRKARERRNESLSARVGRWVFTFSLSAALLAGTAALVRWLLF